MAVSQRYRYVNGMRNIAWLAGFLRKRDNMYYVQQNNNPEHMIPIHVPQHFVMPPEFTPVEAACHVFGVRENDEQNCILKVIEVNRPSIRAMPPMSTWIRGKGKDDFRPFLSTGEIRREFIEKIERDENATEHEKMLAEYFRYAGGRLDARLGENANKVFLAGFVGAYRFVEPNEYQRHGYGEIYLHQYREPERAIPVRVYNPGVLGILRSLKKGMPVAFQGQIRMKVLPDDEGNIRSRNLHVRTEEVFAADAARDFAADPPSWWTDLFREGRKQPKPEEVEEKAPPRQDETQPRQGTTPIEVPSDLAELVKGL